MAEYIDREAAILALLDKGQCSHRYRLGEVWELNFDEIREAIADVPAADVRENVKCNWRVVVNYQNGTETISCPNCQKSDTFAIGPYVKVLFSNFCPNCGAQMGGAEDGAV